MNEFLVADAQERHSQSHPRDFFRVSSQLVCFDPIEFIRFHLMQSVFHSWFSGFISISNWFHIFLKIMLGIYTRFCESSILPIDSNSFLRLWFVYLIVGFISIGSLILEAKFTVMTSLFLLDLITIYYFIIKLIRFQADYCLLLKFV